MRCALTAPFHPYLSLLPSLEVILDAFEGPLDLLLYLIRKQNIDILDIPVADITRQYMEYVEMMRAAQLELAAEYLVMAAMLAEIKSRMLLPRQQAGDDDEEDPRAELARIVTIFTSSSNGANLSRKRLICTFNVCSSPS